MPEITMPRLSDSMEEGTILRWLVADGAQVTRGDEIAEIETDKANMTYESDAAGVFRPVVAEGDALPVGAVIAHVLADGETLPTNGAQPSPATADRAGGAGETISAAPPAESSSPATGPARSSAEPEQGTARVKASPVARRLAGELGVDLASLSGSGPGGRIVKADVEAAASGAVASAQASSPPGPGGPAPSPAAPAAGGTGKGEVTTVELTSIQKTIARRMAES